MTPDETLTKLRTCVGSNKFSKAFQLLNKIVAQDAGLLAELLQLQGRYHELQHELNRGLITTTEKDIRLNQIRSSLLSFIEALPISLSTTALKQQHSALVLPSPPQLRRFVGISVGACLMAIFLLMVLLFNQESLLTAQTNSLIYFLILIVMAACVAIFLFGAIKSYAIVRGNLYGNHFQLGGPLVAFIFIVGLGTSIGFSPTPFDLSINLPGKYAQAIHEAKGLIRYQLGQETNIAYFDQYGQADIKEIPGNFSGEKIKMELEVAGFELDQANPYIIIQPNTSIDLSVRKKAVLGKIFGRVQSTEPPFDYLGQAKITLIDLRIQENLTAYTDATGSFRLEIPLKYHDFYKDYYQLRIQKTNFQNREITVERLEEDQPITAEIGLKPLY